MFSDTFILLNFLHRSSITAGQFAIYGKVKDMLSVGHGCTVEISKSA